MRKTLKKDQTNLILIIPFILISIPYFALLILLGQLIRVGIDPPAQTRNSYRLEFVIEESRKQTEISPSRTKSSSLEVTEQDSEQETYKNTLFGYAFDYPSNSQVKQLSYDNCIKDECKIVNDKLDILKVHSVYISTYKSASRLNYDFDIGLDKNKYKEPRRMLVGGETFYQIVSKQGYLEILAKEYKYIDNTLWIKNEHKVDKSHGDYYVSFDKGVVPEDKILELETILNTFEF